MEIRTTGLRAVAAAVTVVALATVGTPARAGAPGPASQQPGSMEPSAGPVTLVKANGSLRVHAVSFYDPTTHHYEEVDERDFTINYISAVSDAAIGSGTNLSSSASQSTTLQTPGGAFTGLSSMHDVSGRALPAGGDRNARATASSVLIVDVAVSAPTTWRLQASSTYSGQSSPEDAIGAFGVWLYRDFTPVVEAMVGFNGQPPGNLTVDEMVTLQPGAYQLRVQGAGGGLVRAGSSEPGLGTVAGNVTFGAAAALDLANATAPSVTGEHRAGETVVAAPGEWVGDPSDLSYQWLRDGQPIPGATSSSYVVAPADAGRALQVRVSASKPGSLTVEAVSAPQPVARQIFVKKRPVVKGAPAPGKTVRSTRGTWTVKPGSLAYRWLRNGTPIPGATTKKYVVTTADKGERLSVRVTAKRAGHISATATSPDRKVKAA